MRPYWLMRTAVYLAPLLVTGFVVGQLPIGLSRQAAAALDRDAGRFGQPSLHESASHVSLLAIRLSDGQTTALPRIEANKPSIENAGWGIHLPAALASRRRLGSGWNESIAPFLSHSLVVQHIRLQI